MTTTAVFDVNETTLDLGALDPHFEELFGSSAVRKQWFALVLRNALTLTTIGQYTDFAGIARASLEMVADVHGIELTDQDFSRISQQMINLPAHADVEQSLTHLKAAGLRLVAFTNSPPQVANDQITNAGLLDYFDRILTVHETKLFKPHPRVYQTMAASLETPIADMVMVAAHDWDIAGAMAVGMQGAYIVRQGMAVNPLLPQPTFMGNTMTAVTDQIVASLSQQN